MFKNILVTVTAAECDIPVFRAAGALARPYAAHIVFLHVRSDMRKLIAPVAASAEFGSGAELFELLESVERDSIARHDRGRSAMLSFCEAEKITISAVPLNGGPSAEWRVETGDDIEWLAIHGRVADLLVVGRSQAEHTGSMRLLETALMQTGRPLLLLPREVPDRIGKIVAIAWKDTPEAATALTAALPFLARAEQIVILSAAEDDRADAAACERLRGAIAWHNPAVTVQTLQPEPAGPASTLLKVAGQRGADLLVMGGYGHSRVREMVFGGFTRHVLRETTLPVLMAH